MKALLQCSSITRRVAPTSPGFVLTGWLTLLLCLGAGLVGSVFSEPVRATPNTELRAFESASNSVSSGAQVKALASRLVATVDQHVSSMAPADLQLAADVLGNLVSKAREVGASGSVFKALMAHADTLHQRCRDKIRMLEGAAGESEIELERLYRSDVWYDINYALSASGYWKAWAMLGYAETQKGGERVKWLNLAENGFKVSSVRILYPGIIHGSWLGLGYVAQASGEEASAEKRFRRISEVLAAMPDNPMRKLAEAELTILAIRRGEIQQLTVLPKEPLTPSSAAVLTEEAFVLLAQHRQVQSGAIGAAARLKKVIADGFLSDALMARILSYRDEIVGHNLGVVSLLVDAEFAYAYQQYQTAVLKYRKFRKAGGEKLGLDNTPFQYHFAVALLNTNLPRQARTEVRRLQRNTSINQSVVKALPKLNFSVAQAIYQQKSNPAHKKDLVKASKAFIRSAPKDPGVAHAHLALAQISDDPKVAASHLRAAKTDRKLKGEVALAGIRGDVNRFNRATSNGDISAQGLMAKRILESLEDLGRRKRKEPWFRAVSIQMRTVLGESLLKLLEEIDQLLADKVIAEDGSVHAVLVWSKLRVLDALGDEGALGVFVGEVFDTSSQRQVYQFLLEKEKAGDYSLVVDLAERFYPVLDGQAQDQRQLRLLQIRSTTALGQFDEAFEMAQQMVQEFPNSGDAWLAYAEAAEKTKKGFEAERAWVKIASATPEGSPRWRMALTRRIEFMSTGSGSASDPCEAVMLLGKYSHLLDSGQKQLLESQQSKCP